MVPFIDLVAQYRAIQPEIDAAVARVLASGQFALGPEVELFEHAFAAYVGGRHAVAVNTGTSALHLSLLAAGVGPGDEVITVSYTFPATIAAVQYTGATPVLVDIDPATYTIDVGLVERAVTSRTKAILPVHLYGHPADMPALLDIAGRHNLVVIEDAAQAHGAVAQAPVGALGAFGCFSFYPGKNLGACGEGGLVVVADDDNARTIRMLRDWGQAEKYHHVLKGFNYRMDELQGAILAVKLRHLDHWTEARRHHARAYHTALAGLPLVRPVERNGWRHVYHLYVVRVAERERVRAHLETSRIRTGIHYPVPVHLQEAYQDLGYGRGSLPETERAAREVLSLPMFPELQSAQIDRVAEALADATSAVGLS